MTTPTMRDANAGDAAAIAEIYNHYVLSSTVTFDTEPKSVEDRVAWIESRGERHPVIVVERDGRLIGYGALSPWGTRPAYGATAEVAVYLQQGETGAGIGPMVLSALIQRAHEVGLHALVSQIVTENAASIVMCERAGFRTVGTLEQVGRKFDRWLDVALLELLVG